MTALAVWGVEFAGGESWRILSHMMARGIDISTGRPIGNTTRFLIEASAGSGMFSE